jgi:hypothetical protein
MFEVGYPSITKNYTDGDNLEGMPFPSMINVSCTHYVLIVEPGTLWTKWWKNPSDVTLYQFVSIVA